MANVKPYTHIKGIVSNSGFSDSVWVPSSMEGPHVLGSIGRKSEMACVIVLMGLQNPSVLQELLLKHTVWHSSQKECDYRSTSFSCVEAGNQFFFVQNYIFSVFICMHGQKMFTSFMLCKSCDGYKSNCRRSKEEEECVAITQVTQISSTNYRDGDIIYCIS